MKFKLGQKVKVIGSCTGEDLKCWNSKCPYVGNIGTIIDFSSEKGRISIDHFKNNKMWCSGFKPENIEALESKKIELETINTSKEKLVERIKQNFPALEIK